MLRHGGGLCTKWFDGREITVKLLGGELHIKWDRKENLVYMTGPAKIVFEGEVDPYSI